MKPDQVIAQDPRARAAMDRWGELIVERRRYEQDWEDIARLIRPQRGGFGLDSPSMRELSKPLSSAPVVAHGNFAAGIYAGITNPATRWGGLRTPDEDLNRWPRFADWLDRQTAKVMASFSPSMSSFYPSSYQAYADLSAFGNAGTYDQMDRENRRFLDVTLSLAELVVSVDFHGRVDEVVRRFKLTPRQAAREFKALPPKVQELAEKGSTEKHTYYQHVVRNDQFVPRALGPRGKRWLSIYACEVEESLVRVAGYDEMPFNFPRWDVDSGMTYGTGPGFIALASARVNNRMEDATLRAAQRAADPTRFAPDRDAVPLNGTFRPGAVVYGAISPSGQRLIQSDDVTGSIGLTIEEKRAKQEEIKDAFYYTVMSLTGRTGISDDENRVIEEARLRNWAPHADRIMEEYAAPKFERRFRMLLRAGQIDPAPEGTPSDVPLQVHYTSQTALALKASEASSVRRYILGDLLPLAQVKPELMDRISADDYAEVLHEASPSLPQRLLLPREVAAARAREREEQMAALQATQMAKDGGAALRDMAQAGAAMQGGEGG